MFFVLYAAPDELGDSVSVNRTHDSLQDTFVTLYETFLLSYIGQSPADIYYTGSLVPSVSIICHIICLLQFPILMMNLLIAIFSHEVEDVYKFKHEIQCIIKLQLLMALRGMTVSWNFMRGKLRSKILPEINIQMLIFETTEKISYHGDEVDD